MEYKKANRAQMSEDRIPLFPPKIKAIQEGEKRPLWSVMIPTFNCAHYLSYTLKSVLAQAPSEEEMQIEVVDDFSTDADVKALVEEVGKGRVSFYRQPQNRGSLRNFETCLNRAKGKWIHLLHGDDLVKDGFYTEIKDLFTKYPEAGAAFTGVAYIDENGKDYMHHELVSDKPGIVHNFLYKIAQSQWLQPPAIVVKRTIYEQLGSFFGVHYGEDWEMWIRIASHYPVAFSPKYLALYRNHTSNITSHYSFSGQNVKDIDKVIETVQKYLPQELRRELKTAAKKNYSIYFAKLSDQIYHNRKQPKAALRQSIAALKMHFNRTTFYYLIKMYVKKLIRYKIK
jgi:glycosyltransferase involved in cell wall biosynthesis